MAGGNPRAGTPPASPPPPPPPPSANDTHSVANGSLNASNGTANATANASLPVLPVGPSVAASTVSNSVTNGDHLLLPMGYIIAIACAGVAILIVLTLMFVRRKHRAEASPLPLSPSATAMRAQRELAIEKQPIAQRASRGVPSASNNPVRVSTLPAPTLPILSNPNEPSVLKQTRRRTMDQDIVFANNAKRASQPIPSAVDASDQHRHSVASLPPQGVRRISQRSIGPPPLAIVDEDGNVYALQQPLFPAQTAATPPVLHLGARHHGGMAPQSMLNQSRRASIQQQQQQPMSVYRQSMIQQRQRNVDGMPVLVEQEVEGWSEHVLGMPPPAPSRRVPSLLLNGTPQSLH